MNPLDTVEDDVIVLGCLQGYRYAGQKTYLTCPHAGTVDHVLRLDLTFRSYDAGSDPVILRYTSHLYPFADRSSTQPGAPGERHRYVDRIGASVILGKEACQYVIDAC